VHDMHQGSAQHAPEQNHLTKSFRTNDDDRAKKKPSSNQQLIKEFVSYATKRGIHTDFAQEIVKSLERIPYQLTHYTLGVAVNKTLEAIESNAVSHVPNYFLTVLENEMKKRN
jgi:hypothetical protein